MRRSPSRRSAFASMSTLTRVTMAADGAPRNAQQLAHRGLRGAHRKPRRQVVEVTGMPGAVTRPRHPGHDHAMVPAAHPWRRGLEEHLRRAEIEGSPAATTFAAVIARRASPAPATPMPGLGLRPHRHHDRRRNVVVADRFHDRARQPAGALPYARLPHPALPPWFKPSDSSKPKKQAGCTRGPTAQPPTDPAGGRHNCRDARWFG